MDYRRHFQDHGWSWNYWWWGHLLYVKQWLFPHHSTVEPYRIDSWCSLLGIVYQPSWTKHCLSPYYVCPIQLPLLGNPEAWAYRYSLSCTDQSPHVRWDHLDLYCTIGFHRFDVHKPCWDLRLCIPHLDWIQMVFGACLGQRLQYLSLRGVSTHLSKPYGHWRASFRG